MRKWIYSIVIAGCVCATAAVAGARDRDVDRALKKEYPGATTKVIDSRMVNGVRVNDVRITTDQGEATAVITEYGDLIVTGEPRSSHNLSKPAQDTFNGLFKAGQQDVDCYRVTEYLVDVTSGKKSFRIKFDPVGGIHDIYNEADIRKDDVKNLEKISAKDKADKADDYARKYMEGNKVDGVYRFPESDDFFVVDMRQKDGKDARITLNNAGRVYSEREEVDRNDLPKPVAAALKDMFANAKVLRAYRNEYEFYQLDKTTGTGDKISVRVRPNGDVLQVRNEGVTQREQAATHKYTEGHN